MAANFLQLNQDKTEVLVIGPEAQREELLLKLHNLNHQNVLTPHIKTITKTFEGFYHLKNTARVIRVLSQVSTEVLVPASLPSALYITVILSGLPHKTQLTRTRRQEDITAV